MKIEISEAATLSALVGGVMIGLSASLLLLFYGRIAGISGITRKILEFQKGDFFWRAAFVLGLICGGFVLSRFYPEKFFFVSTGSIWRMPLAGILVGFGTSLGGGCTSGHGVCGIARLSKRSIVATLTFMATGFFTVFLMRSFGVLP